MRNKNKIKPKIKDNKSDVQKKLTKSQKKKLQKVLDRRRKKANINDLLGELKKHQLTDEQYAQLTPRFGSKSKGFKKDGRQSTESAGKIYSSGKKKTANLNESTISTTSFKVLDLESSSEDDNSDDDFNEDDLNDKLNKETQKIDSNEVDESDQQNNKDQFDDDKDMKTFEKKRRKTENESKLETKPVIKPVIRSIDSKFVPVNRTEEVIKARNKLPIIAEEANLIDEIKSNPVTIICGETGSVSFGFILILFLDYI